MSRAKPLPLRLIPLAAAERCADSASRTLKGKPRLGGAFAVSLLIHALPVLALALTPHLNIEKPVEKPIVLYSVHLEKKHNAAISRAAERKNTAQSKPHRSGATELDLTGEMRAQKASYEMLLAAKIERQRYYPQLARRLGQEGQPIVRMVMDTMGNIVQLAIENSSGVPLLDETALDIIRRAQPFPPPPQEYALALRQSGGNRLVFHAPISFTLTSAR